MTIWLGLTDQEQVVWYTCEQGLKPRVATEEEKYIMFQVWKQIQREEMGI